MIPDLIGLIFMTLVAIDSIRSISKSWTVVDGRLTERLWWGKKGKQYALSEITDMSLKANPVLVFGRQWGMYGEKLYTLTLRDGARLTMSPKAEYILELLVELLKQNPELTVGPNEWGIVNPARHRWTTQLTHAHHPR